MAFVTTPNPDAMIAFFLPAEIATNLMQLTGSAVATPESADMLHCTLVYLGEIAAIEGQKQKLIDAAREFAAQSQPIVGDINGIGRFFNNEATHAVYANFDAPALPNFRQALVELCENAGIQPVLNHGFTPHITLAYVDPAQPTPSLLVEPINVTFGDLVIAWGDERLSFPMGIEQTVEKSRQEISLRGNFTVRKQSNGVYRWTAISSTNARDRDREIVSNQALELDVYRTKMYGDDSKLRVFHIPYDLGGAPDFRAVVDGCLVETGEFYTTQIATDVAKYIERHPEGTDNTGWGVSIRFKGYPDLDDVYDLIRIRERSPLPSSEAANDFTSLIITEVSDMPLEPRQIEFLKMMAEDPEARDAARAILQAAETSKAIDQAGIQRKSVADSNRFFPLFTQPGNYEAKPADVQKSADGTAEAAAQAVEAVQEAQAAVEVAAEAVAEVATEATATTDQAPPQEPVAEKADQPGDQPVDTPSQVPSKLSEADLQQIAQYVDECVAQHMALMKQQMSTMTDNVQKMLKAVEDGEVLKAHNELPAITLLDRLKQISASRSDATLVKEDDELVQKGKLPEAPKDDSKQVKSRFGFGAAAKQ